MNKKERKELTEQINKLRDSITNYQNSLIADFVRFPEQSAESFADTIDQDSEVMWDEFRELLLMIEGE